jgi:predicted Zn-dependent peptidase
MAAAMLMLLAVHTLAAGETAAHQSAAPQRWDYTDTTLDDGLRVIVMEDHSAPLAAVQVWYHVGSKDESPERQGFAHMFEHMMFRGTERIGPEDHFKYLRRYGGNVNGYTFFDQTVYVEEIPSNQVDLAFWLEAERMANLKINEEYFAKEREVVKEEYRLRISDPPYGQVLEKALGLVFKVHPYRWSPIGNLDHLNAATAAELQAFFDTFYVPNNATLVVVGDVTASEIVEKAKKYFGWIPKAPDPPRITAAEPPQDEPRRLELYDKGPVALVAVGFRAPAARHPDRYAFEIIDYILSGGQSGRLYKKLVKELDLAIHAQSFLLKLEQDGVWGVGAAVQIGQKPEEVEKAILEQIELLLKEGVTEKELEKARNQVAASAIQERQTVAGKAQRLGYAAVVENNIENVNTELQRLQSVTGEDVLRVARKHMTEPARITLIVRPQLAKLGKSLEFLTRWGRKGDDEKKDGDAKESQPATTQPQNGGHDR